MTREEAIREIKNMAKFNYTLAPMEVFDMAIKALEQESKIGHWERDEDWRHHCDVCGAKAPWSWTDGEGFDRMVTPYCPQCGAEMIKWEDADEEWYVHRDEVYGKGK